MGMHDYVVGLPPLKCYKCGSPLAGWQTQSTACQMDEVQFWEASNFYTSCTSCGTWHEFALKPKRRTLYDYELVVSPPDDTGETK